MPIWCWIQLFSSGNKLSLKKMVFRATRVKWISHVFLFYYHGIQDAKWNCIVGFMLLEGWCEDSISGWQFCTNKHLHWYGGLLTPTNCKCLVSFLWVQPLWRWCHLSDSLLFVVLSMNYYTSWMTWIDHHSWPLMPTHALSPQSLS